MVEKKKSALYKTIKRQSSERNDPEKNGPLAPVVNAVEIGVAGAKDLADDAIETTDSILDALFGD